MARIVAGFFTEIFFRVYFPQALEEVSKHVYLTFYLIDNICTGDSLISERAYYD